MTADPLAAVRTALDRAEELEEAAAIDRLESARRELEAVRADDAVDVDEETLRSLEDRLDQHRRAVRERDAYDGSLGAATDPDEEDAP